MKKSKKRQREIHFKSDKCGRVVCVNSQRAKEYAMRLETDPVVESYEENFELDIKQYQHIYRTRIRGSYFQAAWKTDFVLHLANGNIAIRELIMKQDLIKAAVQEQLEFSRRYWGVLGVNDWKVVLVKEEPDVL